MRWLFLATLTAATVSGCGQSPTFSGCARDIYRQYSEAQQTWQLAVHDHIAETKPEFAELIGSSRELQIALIEQSRLRLDYFLEHHPQRISTQGGLSAFTNFQTQWTEVDSEAARTSNPEYAEVELRIRELGLASRDHPGWPALRDYWESAMNEDEALKSALAAFRQTQHNLEPLLQGCNNLR